MPRHSLTFLHVCIHIWICLSPTPCVSRHSTESLQRQLRCPSMGRFSRAPPGPLAALERAVKKACRLVMDQLLLDLQPYLQGLLTRSWLTQGNITPKLCTVLEHHWELYFRVRPPCREVGLPPSRGTEKHVPPFIVCCPFTDCSCYNSSVRTEEAFNHWSSVSPTSHPAPFLQRLQEESQWLAVVEYVRALMQKRIVCRNIEERLQLAERMSQDAQQLRDVFQSTVSRMYWSHLSDWSPPSVTTKSHPSLQGCQML